MDAAAASGELRDRHGLDRIIALEPAAPVRRYERDKPRDLIHIDIKKLGRFNRIGRRLTGDRKGQSNSRGMGWEYLPVVIDDHSRIGFARIMGGERKRSSTAFLKAAVAYYESLGIKVKRVMTEMVLATKPSPSVSSAKTNGTAERFIQTSLREWAYAQAYRNSQWRRPSCLSGRIATTGTGLT